MAKPAHSNRSTITTITNSPWCGYVMLLFAVSVIALPIADSSAVNPTTNSRSLADATQSQNTKPKPDANSKVDQQLEQTALKLVNQHLPELKKLLQNLKKDNPRQYDLAIRDLFKSVRKLELSQKRDEQLYEIEVELLKTQASVKLLAAKLKVRDKESDRKALKESVKRLQTAEIAKAEYNVRYMSERLEKAKQHLGVAESRLASLKDNSESRLEKSYESFLRAAGRSQSKAKKKQ